MKTSVQESLFSKAEACNFFKNETLAYVLSCEFSETAKTTYYLYLQNTSGGCCCNDIVFEAGEALP